MKLLDEIAGFLDKYLEIDRYRDSSWNGLQVEGKDRVRKILCCVDASSETFRKAVDFRADLIVVHHGHFWKNGNPSLRGWQKKRLDILISRGISLYACHLPLDRHRKVGNNALLLKAIGASVSGDFGQYEGTAISWMGTMRKPCAVADVTKTLDARLSTRCRVLAFGPPRIRSVAVCSGGGGYGLFHEAVDRKVDLYLTGDTIEGYAAARDAGMNVIFAGHHATETLGVQALAGLLSRKFPVEAEFLDIPTGL